MLHLSGPLLTGSTRSLSNKSKSQSQMYPMMINSQSLKNLNSDKSNHKTTCMDNARISSFIKDLKQFILNDCIILHIYVHASEIFQFSSVRKVAQ